MHLHLLDMHPVLHLHPLKTKSSFFWLLAIFSGTSQTTRVDELIQESRLVEDEFVNESEDLRTEEDEEINEIMDFVFGEEIDSDCEI